MIQYGPAWLPTRDGRLSTRSSQQPHVNELPVLGSGEATLNVCNWVFGATDVWLRTLFDSYAPSPRHFWRERRPPKLPPFMLRRAAEAANLRLRCRASRPGAGFLRKALVPLHRQARRGRHPLLKNFLQQGQEGPNGRVWRGGLPARVPSYCVAQLRIRQAPAPVRRALHRAPRSKGSEGTATSASIRAARILRPSPPNGVFSSCRSRVFGGAQVLSLIAEPRDAGGSADRPGGPDATVS